MRILLHYLMFIMVQMFCIRDKIGSLAYNFLPDELQDLLMELLESIIGFTKLMLQ